MSSGCSNHRCSAASLAIAPRRGFSAVNNRHQQLFELPGRSPHRRCARERRSQEPSPMASRLIAPSAVCFSWSCCLSSSIACSPSGVAGKHFEDRGALVELRHHDVDKKIDCRCHLDRSAGQAALVLLAIAVGPVFLVKAPDDDLIVGAAQGVDERLAIAVAVLSGCHLTGKLPVLWYADSVGGQIQSRIVYVSIADVVQGDILRGRLIMRIVWIVGIVWIERRRVITGVNNRRWLRRSAVSVFRLLTAMAMTITAPSVRSATQIGFSFMATSACRLMLRTGWGIPGEDPDLRGGLWGSLCSVGAIRGNNASRSGMMTVGRADPGAISCPETNLLSQARNGAHNY